VLPSHVSSSALQAVSVGNAGSRCGEPAWTGPGFESDVAGPPRPFRAIASYVRPPSAGPALTCAAISGRSRLRAFQRIASVLPDSLRSELLPCVTAWRA